MAAPLLLETLRRSTLKSLECTFATKPAIQPLCLRAGFLSSYISQESKNGDKRNRLHRFTLSVGRHGVGVGPGPDHKSDDKRYPRTLRLSNFPIAKQPSIPQRIRNFINIGLISGIFDPTFTRGAFLQGARQVNALSLSHH